MERDLSDILAEWPYESGRINVRLVQGSNGDPLIQIRLDLGLLQLRADGRPDGSAPMGYGSLLEYHETRLDSVMAGGPPIAPPGPESKAPISLPGSDPNQDNAIGDAEPSDEDGEHAPDRPAAPPSDGTPEPEGMFSGDEPGLGDETTDGPGLDDGESPRFLSGEDCRALREEAMQFYHRYVAFFVLEDYDGVLRDTSRNLRVLDICRDHAIDPGDRAALEQFRPYILMMRTRALANQAIRDSETKAAIFAIDDGLDAMRAHYEASGGDGEDQDTFESSREADALRSIREALIPKLPVSQKAELRQRLTEALDTENYELAAILRDELRLLGIKPPSPPPPPVPPHSPLTSPRSPDSSHALILGVRPRARGLTRAAGPRRASR